MIRDITDAMKRTALTGDHQKVADALDHYGLRRGGAAPLTYLGHCHQMIAKTLIGTAIAMSCTENRLTPQMVDEIAERTACLVDMEAFLELVVARVLDGGKTADYSKVPEAIRRALNDGAYASALDEEIERMGREEFEALLVYTLDERAMVNRGAMNAALIRRIRKENMLPDELVLGYMGLALHRFLEEDDMEDWQLNEHCQGCVCNGSYGCGGTDENGECID